ncbi:MAG: BolA/IbaG family iron-sulfur metabolism protein [Alphaproteobacteria bacterium]|nr:BolA/IbaG family iron-sulfur metabolism protein [Alphaproteobacteria bacterium]
MSIHDQVKQAIEAAIPGAVATVTGGGGHFEIDVVSDAFAGKRTLAQHRMVLQSIKDLMAGNDAPVHAVDRMTCRLPGA